jgi:hypothetical protein
VALASCVVRGGQEERGAGSAARDRVARAARARASAGHGLQQRRATQDAGVRPREAIDWGQRAIELAERLDDDEILAHALNNVGSAELQAGIANGAAKLERSLDLALGAGLHEHAARAFTNLATNHVTRRDFEAAAGYLDAGIDFCRERDLDSWWLYMTGWLAREARDRGVGRRGGRREHCCSPSARRRAKQDHAARRARAAARSPRRLRCVERPRRGVATVDAGSRSPAARARRRCTRRGALAERRKRSHRGGNRGRPRARARARRLVVGRGALRLAPARRRRGHAHSGALAEPFALELAARLSKQRSAGGQSVAHTRPLLRFRRPTTKTRCAVA